jgi:hypothetical protein
MVSDNSSMQAHQPAKFRKTKESTPMNTWSLESGITDKKHGP